MKKGHDMSFVTVSHPCRPVRRTRLSAFYDLLALRRQRQELRHLDDRALDDMGITRAEARTEANRPFWDAPHHWLK